MPSADIPGLRTAQQRAGDAAEGFVAERLSAAGWTVLTRNVRLGRLEVDLLAIDPGPPAELVLLEVRWRRSREFGLPEETFDARKRRHLRAAVAVLLGLGELPGGSTIPRLPVRIDLVVVEPPARVGEPPRMRHHRAALAG